MRNALLGAGMLACALSISGCKNAVVSANNTLANLVGGANSAGVAEACSLSGPLFVAIGYFTNVASKVTPAEVTAEAAAEAVVKNLCATPPTNLTVLFSDLLSSWNVIQAATTVPTSTNPNPSVPPLVTN
jgi:hypothetical protein